MAQMVPVHAELESGVLEMRQLFFNNLNLLGFDGPAMEASNHIPFNKSMFDLPNRRGAEIVLHYLFQRLNSTMCREAFRDCWPILDKKREMLFRKTCASWLSNISQEESDSHLPRINASLFMSPGGEKFIQLLYLFSSYVLQKVLDTELGSKQSDRVRYPTLTQQNLQLVGVIEKDLTCAAIRHRKRFFDVSQQILKANRVWKDTAHNNVREYRKLIKEIRENDYKLREEEQRATEACLIRGSPSKRRGQSDHFEPDFDPRTIKRAQRLQQVREMWKQLETFDKNEAAEREVIRSIVERTVEKNVINAADISVKVPDLLLRECQEEIRRRNIENTYQGGRLNLVSLLQLWHLSLELYLEKIKEVGIPQFEDASKLTSQVHTQQSYLQNAKTLRQEMSDRIPEMKSSVAELSSKLDTVFFVDKSPGSIRSTVSEQSGSATIRRECGLNINISYQHSQLHPHPHPHHSGNSHPRHKKEPVRTQLCTENVSSTSRGGSDHNPDPNSENYVPVKMPQKTWSTQRELGKEQRVAGKSLIVSEAQKKGIKEPNSSRNEKLRQKVLQPEMLHEDKRDVNAVWKSSHGNTSSRVVLKEKNKQEQPSQSTSRMRVRRIKSSRETSSDEKQNSLHMQQMNTSVDSRKQQMNPSSSFSNHIIPSSSFLNQQTNSSSSFSNHHMISSISSTKQRNPSVDSRKQQIDISVSSNLNDTDSLRVRKDRFLDTKAVNKELDHGSRRDTSMSSPNGRWKVPSCGECWQVCVCGQTMVALINTTDSTLSGQSLLSETSSSFSTMDTSAGAAFWKEDCTLTETDDIVDVQAVSPTPSVEICYNTINSSRGSDQMVQDISSKSLSPSSGYLSSTGDKGVTLGPEFSCSNESQDLSGLGRSSLFTDIDYSHRLEAENGFRLNENSTFGNTRYVKPSFTTSHKATSGNPCEETHSSHFDKTALSSGFGKAAQSSGLQSEFRYPSSSKAKTTARISKEIVSTSSAVVESLKMDGLRAFADFKHKPQFPCSKSGTISKTICDSSVKETISESQETGSIFSPVQEMESTDTETGMAPTIRKDTSLSDTETKSLSPYFSSKIKKCSVSESPNKQPTYRNNREEDGLFTEAENFSDRHDLSLSIDNLSRLSLEHDFFMSQCSAQSQNIEEQILSSGEVGKSHSSRETMKVFSPENETYPSAFSPLKFDLELQAHSETDLERSTLTPRNLISSLKSESASSSMTNSPETGTEGKRKNSKKVTFLLDHPKVL